MKILAKHGSLKNLIKMKGWGLVGTNEYVSITKAHLLDLRSAAGGKLVFDISPFKGYPARYQTPGHPGNISFLQKYMGRVISGSDWNSNFYGINFRGFFFAREAFPEMKEELDEMLVDVFDNVFNTGSLADWEERLK